MSSFVTVERWPKYQVRNVLESHVRQEKAAVIRLWFELPKSDPLGRQFSSDLKRFVDQNLFGFELCQGRRLMVDSKLSQRQLEAGVERVQVWIREYLVVARR